MRLILFAATVMGLLGGFAVAAQASPIAIYNTGSYNSGSSTSGGLAAQSAADPHWTVCSTTPTSSAPTAPCGTAPVAAMVVTKSSQPGVWATNPASQWIGPKALESVGSGGNDPAGYYEYQTSFDLTGLDPGSASLSGSFAVDNCVVQVFINGTATGIANTGVCTSSANLTGFLTFNIGSGFISGVNTLTFVMQNGTGGAGNPSGLNVLVSGNANPLAVPEPAAFGLLGLAFFGLGGLWLRRRA